MKKIFLFLSLLILFTTVKVNANYKKVNLTYDNVSIRKGPGSNYNRITYVSSGLSFYLDSDTVYADESSDCSTGWYKIKYNNDYGYICQKYVEVYEINEDILNTCKTDLINGGFPESYVTSLCELKQRHASWNFIPLKIELDWQSAIDNESVCGSSYVYTDEEESIDRTCTNVYNTSGLGWYPASKKIVAYYMDPRNFLSDRYIFQFENLYYNENVKSVYPGGVNTILSGAAFYQYHVSLGTDFSKIIDEAALSVQINPVFLSSRIKQELGSSTKLYNLYSGVYEGFEGYYNFYNFGVSDYCANTNGTTYCGLNYAKNNGWNSLYNAISGGASQIKAGYLDAGQYLNYFQKFNVNPTSSTKLYIHQYMSNISAPSSESTSMYNAYKVNNGLDNAFNFYIPIYNNMSVQIDNSSSGATDDGNESSLNSADIGTIITSAGYKISSEYFSGIAPETSASVILSGIEAVGGKASISECNNQEFIGTGCKITIQNKTESITYIIVVNGDTSGDGKITALDLAQVQKNILGMYTLDGANYAAGDTSDDNNITALDLAQIQKNILGSYEIVK